MNQDAASSTNGPDFDPYRKWLGIPKDQRPPSHYQLLGIAVDEDDVEVIEEASMMRSAHLRNFQTGPHADLCANLLTEIAEAVDVLRDAGKRKAYDEKLIAVASQKAAASESPATPADSRKSDTAAAYRLANQCFQKHDYAQVVELLQQIPDAQRSSRVQSLLNSAIERQDEVDLLVASLDQAIESHQFDGLRPDLERLLKLRPGHRRARQVLEELKAGGGKLVPSRRESKYFDVAGQTIYPWMIWTAVGVAVVAFGITLWAVKDMFSAPDKLPGVANTNSHDSKTSSARKKSNENSIQKKAKSRRKQFSKRTTTGTATDLERGLVVHVSFDETDGRSANEIISKSTSQSTGNTDWTDGRIGKAMFFDDRSHLEVGNLADFDRDTPFSYGAWVYPSSRRAITVIAKMKIGKTRQTRAHQGFDLVVIGRHPTAMLANSWPTDCIVMRTEEPLELGRWHHVMVTYDGSSTAAGFQLYGNGKLMPVGNPQDSLTQSIRTTEPLVIGRRGKYDDSEHPFLGTIDDVRIYDRELSPTEVSLLASQGDSQPTGAGAPIQLLKLDAGKRILLIMDPNELAVTRAVCDEYGLKYDVEENFDSNRADYSAYHTVVLGTNRLRFWGETEDWKNPEAFEHVDSFVRSGGHLIVFGNYNGERMEQLNRFGVFTYFYHSASFAAVPGSTDLFLQDNLEFVPANDSLQSAGNFAVARPNVFLLQRGTSGRHPEQPAVAAIPIHDGVVTVTMVEPSWKDDYWLIRPMLSWTSRGCPVPARNWPVTPALPPGAEESPRYSFSPPEPALVRTIETSAGSNGAVVLPPGGTRVASTLPDGAVRVWDLQTGLMFQDSMVGNIPARLIQFAKDRNSILTRGDDNIIRYWDLRTPRAQKPIRQFDGHREPITGIAVWPGRGSFLTWGGDQRMIRWELKTGKQMQTYGYGTNERVPRVVTQRTLSGIRGHVRPVRFAVISGHAQRIVSVDELGLLIVWDSTTGVIQHRLLTESPKITCLAVSHDATVALLGDEQGQIHLQNLDSDGVIRTFGDHSGEVLSVTFSKCGEFAASAGAAGRVCVWEIDTGRRLHQFEEHNGAANWVLFTPHHDNLVSSDDDQTVRIWKLPRLISSRTPQDRDVAEWALELGGQLDFMMNGTRVPIRYPAALPNHAFQILTITLRGCQRLTNSGLAKLQALPELKQLNLIDTPISDDGLKQLVSLQNLDLLYLDATEIDGSGFIHLQALKNLQRLRLRNLQISDASLEHLKSITSLTALDLRETPVTDAGLAHLAPLTSLTYLDLVSTGVEGNGLRHLANLPELQRLLLHKTGVRDDDLKHLSGLSKLQYLNLEYTNVTDACVGHLKGLTSLTDLRLTGTEVSKSAIRELQAALPKCKIR